MNELIGVIGIVAVVAIILMGVPVAVALGIVGFLGYAAVDGFPRALIALGSTPFDLAQSYALSVVPLFVLMGVVAARSTMARELFEAANAIFSGARGALAMATVGACAGFGAICGSSLATAATIARIAIPEMRRHGYADTLATGVVASAGTLGILIPPSVILIVYAVVAEQSVAELFAAAMIPGLVLAALHVVGIRILVAMDPKIAPVTPSLPAAKRLRALSKSWKLAALFGLSVGGIYLGWFSPTEAAAVGAFGAIVLAMAGRELDLLGLRDAFMESIRTTAVLFFVIVGAFLFGYFIVQSKLAATLGEWITSLGVPAFAVILLFIVIYLVLGCVLDSISMLLITTPVFLPIAQSLGYSPVWFGVMFVLVAEIGLITPPVGLNIFVIRVQTPDIPIGTMFKGVTPFVLVGLTACMLLLAFPELALWLPRALAG